MLVYSLSLPRKNTQKSNPSCGWSTTSMSVTDVGVALRESMRESPCGFLAVLSPTYHILKYRRPSPTWAIFGLDFNGQIWNKKKEFRTPEAIIPL